MSALQRHAGESVTLPWLNLFVNIGIMNYRGAIYLHIKFRYTGHFVKNKELYEETIISIDLLGLKVKSFYAYGVSLL